MTSTDFQDSVTATPKVGDAVGVEKVNWYIAIVGNNTERQCAKRLEVLGYECYVPTQIETRTWRNGTRNTVEKTLIPSYIFIHTTETERKQHIVKFPFIKRFMPNKAKNERQVW